MISSRAVAPFVAALVPVLLDAHAETAEPLTVAALAEAIDRCAEALICWHDQIVGVRVVAIPAAARPRRLERVPVTCSRELRRSIRDGVMPADVASIGATAAHLHRVAGRIYTALQADLDDGVRQGGQQIAEALDRLSGILNDHAYVLRTESGRLARTIDRAAQDVIDVRTQILGRVTRAEHVVHRAALATLP